MSDLVPLFGGATTMFVVTVVLSLVKGWQRAQRQETRAHLNVQQAWIREARRLELEITKHLPSPRISSGDAYRRGAERYHREQEQSKARPKASWTPVVVKTPNRAPGGIVRGPMVNFGVTGAVAAEQMRVLAGGCAHTNRHEVRLSSNELVAWICKGCNMQLVNEKWVASGS